MSIVYKYPASKLPTELREGLADDALVTVEITKENEVLPGYSQDEIDALLVPAIEQEKRGEGTVCRTPEEIDAHFESLIASVKAKHKLD